MLSKRSIIIAIALLLVVGAVVGVVVYIDRVAPARMTVVEVNGHSIEMGYFLKRVSMGENSPVSTLQAISREEIIRQVASQEPYNIEVSREDVDAYLRETARGGAETLSEDEFGEWYRQRLNETRLSDAEYRELARTDILIRRLSEHVAGRVPSRAEQAHLFAISLTSPDDVAEATERLEAGESFQQVAAELSSDPELAQSRGELGWFVRGLLPSDVESAVFGALSVGEVSAPLRVGEQLLLVKVTARQERDLDGRTRSMLQAMAFEEWLTEVVREQDVEFHGFENGYDSATNEWVWAQVREMDQ